MPQTTPWRPMSLALVCFLGACAELPDSCPSGTQPMTRLELSFGGDVSAADWARFLADDVTPRFPDGFTVTDAYGQWRSGEGIVAMERSRVLMVVVPTGGEPRADVDAVRDAYKTRFSQESVLLVRSSVCAGF